MKNKKLVMGCSLAAVVVLLGLFFMARGGSNVKEIAFENYETSAATYVYLEQSAVNEKVTLSGWGFCETQKANDGKSISVVLCNPEKAYEIATTLSPREDVTKAYETLAYGTQHGYTAEFSPTSIDNGTYEIYVFCKENEASYGIKSVEKQLVKNGDTVAVQPLVNAAVEIPQAESGEKKGEANIDICTVEEGVLVLQGWGFAEGQDCNGQTIYISFDQGKTGYATKQISRPDVAAAYTDEKYTQSGFQTRIPVEGIVNTSLVAQVLVEKDGQVSLLKEVSLVTEENGKQYLGGMELPADRLSAAEAAN